MAVLYLEFKQEDILLAGLPDLDFLRSIENNTSDEDEEVYDPDEEDDDEMSFDEGSIFTPLYFYTKPFTGCMEVEVSDAVATASKAHLVLVRYTEGLDTGNPALRWIIAGVFDRRREAKELEQDIEDGKYKGNKPWEGDDSMLDEIEIYSLDIED